MKTQDNKLTAKEISVEMSPTPWRACHEGDCSCGQIWSEPQDMPVLTGERINEMIGEIPLEQMKTNVKAATIAVNNTYGKNLDPEVYEDVVNCLDHFIDILSSEGYGELSSSAFSLIQKARL